MNGKARLRCAISILATTMLTLPCGAQSFKGTHLSSAAAGYPLPPLIYENNQIVTVTFKTTPAVLRELVPEPLAINEGSLLTIYIGRLHIVEPERITYYEAGIFIPASYGVKQGGYMPVLYLDQALPITIGREVWGFPKFHAELSFEVRNGVVHASVVKEGTTLIDLTSSLGEPVSPVAPPQTAFFLAKTIPSAKGLSTFDVRQLTTAVWRNRVNSVVNPGKATLRLGSTASDPLGLIPVLEVVSSTYTVGGFILDYGEIVYDYLAEQGFPGGESSK